MRVKTTLINIAIAAFSVFAASLAVSLAVGPAENIVKDTGSAQFVSLLAITALSQFIVNSLCVAVIVAIKTEMPVWKVWNESCLNTLVMFVSAAVMAGFGVIALEQINVFLFVAVILFFAVVCFTYQRYVDDIRQTSARAEQAERDRAEEAERHVRELELYVDELEKSGEALSESREKFRHAAFHDALTGLPNRNHFVDALITLAEKSGSCSKLKFAILFLDLNCAYS